MGPARPPSRWRIWSNAPCFGFRGFRGTISSSALTGWAIHRPLGVLDEEHVVYGEEKMNRRDWLLGTLATMPLQAQKNRSLYAYVGCYTTEQRHGRGDGIHVYRVDSATGVWSPAQQVGNLVNPSFLVASRDGRFLYSVHGDESYATAFAIDPQ